MPAPSGDEHEPPKPEKPGQSGELFVGQSDSLLLLGTSAKDLASASEWVRKLPQDIARDCATAALVEALSESDPEAARVWAADIKDDKIREEARKNLDP